MYPFFCPLVYIRCNFSIFFFNDLTERLGGCLYKCGCLVKLSILMSMTRKNSFFQSLRACTPTPSFLDQRLQYVWSASSTISRHLVKSILDGSLYSIFRTNTVKMTHAIRFLVLKFNVNFQNYWCRDKRWISFLCAKWVFLRNYVVIYRYGHLNLYYQGINDIYLQKWQNSQSANRKGKYELEKITADTWWKNSFKLA